MTFAIDFDDTFSESPRFFHEFLDLIEKYGHKAYLVTARYKEMNNKDIVETVRNRIPIVFCGMKNKRSFCENNGIFIDVWIDDLPEYI